MAKRMRRDEEDEENGGNQGGTREAELVGNLKALNSQFAQWVQQQQREASTELWTAAAKDYIKHAEDILSKYKDVLKSGGAPAGPSASFSGAPAKRAAMEAPAAAASSAPKLPLFGSLQNTPAASSSALAFDFASKPGVSGPAASAASGGLFGAMAPRSTGLTFGSASAAFSSSGGAFGTPVGSSAYNSGSAAAEEFAFGTSKAPSASSASLTFGAGSVAAFGGGSGGGMFGSGAAAFGKEAGKDFAFPQPGGGGLFGSKPGGLFAASSSSGTTFGSTTGALFAASAGAAATNGEEDAAGGDDDAADEGPPEPPLKLSANPNTDVLFDNKAQIRTRKDDAWGDPRVGMLTVRRDKASGKAWLQLSSESGTIIMYAACLANGVCSIIGKTGATAQVHIGLNHFDYAPGAEPDKLLPGENGEPPKLSGEKEENKATPRATLIKLKNDRVAALKGALEEVGYTMKE